MAINNEGLAADYALVNRDTDEGIHLTGVQVRAITYAVVAVFAAGVTDNPLAALATIDEASRLLTEIGVDPAGFAEIGRELVTFHAPTLAEESEEYAKSVRLAENAQYN